MLSKDQNRNTRWLIIFCLVFAGEMNFSLPFHVARFFRPTLLEVFNLTNSELGDAIAVYGIMAMIAYFPGGTLADRFSARKLMAYSLFATAFGGFFFAMIPGQLGLSILFGYWGITTIFLFWAAMIKVTREWGGKLTQGKAFGILDGGRGLMAAIAATLAVFILDYYLNNKPSSILTEDRKQALVMIIYYYSFLTAISGLLVLILIPEPKLSARTAYRPFDGIKKVIVNKSVWLQAIIVVCAYCGYKGLDYYSLYAVDILDMNEVSSSKFVSNASYLRAVAAIVAGFIVDRFSASKVIIYTFGILVISYVFIGLVSPSASLLVLIYGNIIITFSGVYALRGVYFALLEETKIPGLLTGTAVGLISVIGYSPDAFFNSVAGRILDNNPGLTGYHNYFLMLAGFSLLGLVATVFLSRTKKQVD